MKNLLVAAFIAGSALAVTPAIADPNVSISVGGQIAPGVYGQIDIGHNNGIEIYGPPVIIQRGPYNYPPAYYYVPDVQRRDWGRWCRHYRACDREVYFVRPGQGYRHYEEHDRRWHRENQWKQNRWNDRRRPSNHYGDWGGNRHYQHHEEYHYRDGRSHEHRH